MNKLLNSTGREAILAEVRAEMARQRVTQRTLAKSTDNTEASVSRWLHGHRDIGLADLLAICDQLDVTLATLAARADSTKDAA